MSNENKFLIGIGIVTVVAIAVGVFIFGRGEQTATEAPVEVSELVGGARHTIGEASATATIVEFGDYQCPACSQAHPIVKQFLQDHGANVLFVYRHFPLTQIHPNANDAARAAEAAGEQGKYFEMHNMLYEKQGEWSGLSDPRGKFEQYAQELQLDLEKFKTDMGNAIGVINADAALAKKVGVSSTPTFFINGEKRSGVVTYDELISLTQ